MEPLAAAAAAAAPESASAKAAASVSTRGVSVRQFTRRLSNTLRSLGPTRLLRSDATSRRHTEAAAKAATVPTEATSSAAAVETSTQHKESSKSKSRSKKSKKQLVEAERHEEQPATAAKAACEPRERTEPCETIERIPSLEMERSYPAEPESEPPTTNEVEPAVGEALIAEGAAPEASPRRPVRSYAPDEGEGLVAKVLRGLLVLLVTILMAATFPLSLAFAIKVWRLVVCCRSAAQSTRGANFIINGYAKPMQQ